MHRWKILAAACALCAAAAGFAAVPRMGAAAGPLPPDTVAAGAVIDQVVATIEDRAIMQSDVDNALKRYLLDARRTAVPADEEKAIKRDVLSSLVADALLAIQAEKDNIKVEEKEVDEAIERSIEERKTALGGDEAFARQLAAEGLTIDALRERYRENSRMRLLIYKIKYQKIRPDVQVTEAEVREYYKAHLSEIPQKEPTVSIAYILIVIMFSRINELQETKTSGADLQARVITVIFFACIAFSWVGIVKLSNALHSSSLLTIVIATCMCVPLVNIAIVLALNHKATSFLRDAGVEVNFLGVSR